MCVSSLLCGPRADLWPFYGFLCKRFSLYINVYQGRALQRNGPTDPPKENGRRVADSILLPLFSFSSFDVNGSKRLSLTPSVSNLCLRPCRYLSTVTRSSSQGSVDGFRRERLQRFAIFDSLSVQRRLEAR